MSIHKQQGSVKSYLTGFVLSLLFTIAPYLLVTRDILDGSALLLALAVFAIAQVFVQLLCFLHLRNEARPRLQSIAFAFMTLVVVIVVFGSLWIMNNLDYHMTMPQDTDKYIQDEEAITPNAQ